MEISSPLKEVKLNLNTTTKYEKLNVGGAPRLQKLLNGLQISVVFDSQNSASFCETFKNVLEIFW